jgi:hypothetical protein
LYYYKARIYNPTLGRFMQTDPIGYKGDNDLYAYVGNDPLDRADSSGEDSNFCGNGGIGSLGVGSCHNPDDRDKQAQSRTSTTTQSRTSALNLNYFSPASVAASVHMGNGSATFTTPSLNFFPDPTIGLANFSIPTSSSFRYQPSTGANIFLGAVGVGAATGGAITVSTTIGLGGGAAAVTAEGGIIGAGIAAHEVFGSWVVGSALGAAGGVVIGGFGVLLYEMSKLPPGPGYGAPIGPNGTPLAISPY